MEPNPHKGNIQLMELTISRSQHLLKSINSEHEDILHNIRATTTSGEFTDIINKDKHHLQKQQDNLSARKKQKIRKFDHTQNL